MAPPGKFVSNKNVSEFVSAIMAGQTFFITPSAPTGYTRQFQHKDWTDFVDPVQAGGNNGFNERFHALETEFDLIASSITSVDNAVANLQAAPPAIGLTVVVGLSDGASIPVPSGFQASETKFFAFVKAFVLDLSQRSGTLVGFRVFANDDGTVTVFAIGGTTGEIVVATGVAIAKKGGW